MNTTNMPADDAAADDDPNDPVTLTGRAKYQWPTHPALIGANLVMVLIMASVVGLLLGVVVLVELLT